MASRCFSGLYLETVTTMFLAIIGVIVIIIIAGAWYAGTHAIYNASYRFVRRTGTETKRFVRSVNEEDKDRKHYVHKAD